MLAVATFATTASAACQELMPYYVTVEWGDGSTTGHWQFGWFDVPCDMGGGGDYSGGGGYGGPHGGGGAPTYPADMTTQRQEYIDNDCTVPPYSAFLDEAAYNQSGLQNFFSFSDFSTGGEPYVIVDPALVTGIASISDCMDNQLPPISDPNNGGGYRGAGDNNDTPCGYHTKGQAVDLSTRAMDSYGNFTGAHDCVLWNALAQCAHNAGAWVEPWSTIKDSGVIHMHVSFGQPANTPADYGDACANP